MVTQVFQESFFDEMEKISSSLIGAGIGAGMAGANSLRRELRLRSQENPADPEVKAQRRRRLKYMAGSVAVGAGGGALVGHLAKKGLSRVGKKVREEVDAGASGALQKATSQGGSLDKLVDRTTPKIREEASRIVEDVAPKIRAHAVAAAEETPAAVGRGAVNSLRQLASRARGAGSRLKARIKSKLPGH